jgi:hypothetical protein
MEIPLTAGYSTDLRSCRDRHSDTVSQEVVMTNIELYGSQVIRRVRDLCAQPGPEPLAVRRETFG